MLIPESPLNPTRLAVPPALPCRQPWPVRRAWLDWLGWRRPVRPGAASGRLLRQLVMVGDAQLVIALGTGDGLAAVGIAEALRALPGRRGDRALIAFEPTPAAAARVRDRLRRAGVSRHADVRADAPLRALAGVEGPIDLLLLAPFDAAAAELLATLAPRLRGGASVLVPGRAGQPVLVAALAALETRFEALHLSVDGGLHWLVKH